MTPALRLILPRTGQPLATQAVVAATFLQRLRGLLGRDAITEGEAMIFPGCRAIHTIGMRCAIDVVFVDRAWRVVALVCALPPQRFAGPIWKAWGAVEMAAGTIARLDLRLEDQLRIDEAS